MSGGSLVVLDRAGRDVKRYPLPEGLATLGSDPACDIRVMLPSVSPHHATVVVHTNQCIVRNVGAGETLVNGRPVSVAALAHGDLLGLGARCLRWEYSRPAALPPALPQLSGARRGAGSASRGRRGSVGGAASARDRALQLQLELHHRASMPGSTGGKQVAVVQPQRRDTAEQNERAPRASLRAPRSDLLQATKASIWIHSRKTSPRNTTKEARSARRPGSARPLKILPPATIDDTKRAALLLMAGRGPRRDSAPVFRPKPRQARRHRHNRHSMAVLTMRASEGSTPPSSRGQQSQSNRSLRQSPILPNTRKSALRDPTNKKPTRKTESIKFDLSNLYNRDESVVLVTNTTHSPTKTMSEDDLTLHYSDTSNSPSPRIPIQSRSSRMLKSLGASVTLSPSKAQDSRTLTPHSPRRTPRGHALIQKALATHADGAGSTTTGTPRSPSHMKSYSIVDLVSIDSSNSRSTSVYNSIGSVSSSAFGTPSNKRKSRSTIDPTLLGSSTPYVKATRSKSRTSDINSQNSSVNTKPSNCVSTPENTQPLVSVNSTRISRRSRSRSRINDSDLVFISGDENDDSPKSSRRSKSQKNTTDVEIVSATPEEPGTRTPENRHSLEEATTPVLSIQSLLDSSQSSGTSVRTRRRGRPSIVNKRKTIGVITAPKTKRSDVKFKSLIVSSVRKTRLRLSKDGSEMSDYMEAGLPADEEVATPTSAVTLEQEAVKNKHSTAKKPQSKRSIIDDLNRSDIVKQLFNSPVKRKLSQSMTEFSRKHLDDDDLVAVRRPTRNTVALTGRTPDNSLLEQSDAYTPDVFVSPIHTASNSPNLSGLKRLFKNNSPHNDLRNVRGVRDLLRTPRTRQSVKNDLTKVSGVKRVFAKSPRNSLSNVRVKRAFVVSPENDLTRVHGVKTLFQPQRSPNNDLSDVRGVKRLFRGSPVNDLRNVTGVKRTLRGSPRNDLSDVRGVRRMFKETKEKQQHDISGVEALFNESCSRSENLFDQLVGKPQVKAVYSKSFAKNGAKKTTRNTKSLHSSIDLITNNVEEWLEKELQKRLHKDEAGVSNNTVSRELQKLATSTVEGNDPLRPRRARDSTAQRSIDPDRRSASDIYGAHTLPIKKRSINRSANASAQLPLKKRLVVHSTPAKDKRLVVHSTPVKGKRAPSAAELGRVSPIAASDTTTIVTHDISNRSTQPVEQIAKPKPKSRRETKATTAKETATKLEKSPEKLKSPELSRATRRTVQADATPERTTRRREPKTPKNTRARVVKAAVVVTKPSPQIRPRRARNTELISKQSPPELEKRNTRAAAQEIEPKVRSRRTIVKKTDSEQSDEPVRATRGRKAKVEELKTEPSFTKSRRKATQVQTVSVQSEPITRGKKAQEQTQSPKPVKETRKAVKITKPEVPEKQVRTRGKRGEPKETEQLERPKRGARAKVQPAIEINTRKRRAATENEPPKSKRKDEIEPPVEVSKATRARKRVVETTQTETGNTRQRRAVVKDSQVQEPRREGDGNRSTRVARSRKVVELTTTTATRRGRKAAAAEEPTQQVETRKRKTNVDTSPALAQGSKRARRQPPAARETRASTQVKTTGRARR